MSWCSATTRIFYPVRIWTRSVWSSAGRIRERWLRRLWRRGKHVNMEVPAAHTMEDCWRIVTAAERTGRVYQLAEQTRYWGFVDAWRDLVAEGRLGRVTYCEGQYIGYYGTRQFFQDYKTRPAVPRGRASVASRGRTDVAAPDAADSLSSARVESDAEGSG